MTRQDFERFAILLLFGASLALFFWRFRAPVDVPTAVEPKDVPPVAPPGDPRNLVGMSFTPDNDPEQFGPWFYTANMPQSRPWLTPMTNVVQ